MFRKLFTAGLLLSSVLTCTLSAQTAYAMPGKWYDEIVYARDNNSRIPLETKFNVTFDQKAMTVRLRMKDPHAADLKKLPRGKSSVVWLKYDSIEIFLDPGRSCGKYLQLAVGADHGRWDRRWTQKVKTSWTSKVTITKDGWNVDVRIPYTDPGMMKPRTGDRWGFNICRNVISPKNSGRYYSTWARVGAAFNRPEKFGLLIFGDPNAAKRAAQAKVRKELKKVSAELKRKGFYTHFAARIKELEQDGTEIDVRDIRDELLVLENMKGL